MLFKDQLQGIAREPASHSGNFRVSDEYLAVVAGLVIFQIIDSPHKDINAILAE